MFAIQYAFQFLMIVVDRCGIVVDRCGSLWVVVDRCGSLWVVPGFSNYETITYSQDEHRQGAWSVNFDARQN